MDLLLKVVGRSRLQIAIEKLEDALVHFPSRLFVVDAVPFTAA